MMRFGIPKYRLPREVLDAEMQRVVDIGVEVKLNTKVDNILETMKKASSTPPSSPSAPTSASAP
jgi:NADPH-dependent glutamate synthase beta subunit-like oxidoreductase